MSTSLRWLMNGVLALGLVVIFTPSALAKDLTPKQAQSLRNAANKLKAAAGDLQAAASTVGTAERPAKGARRKLTNMRIASAEGQLNAATKMLADLPADHSDVSRVATAIEAGRTKIATFKKILGSGGTTAPIAKGPKLHYQQEGALKDARYYNKLARDNHEAAKKILDAYNVGGNTKPVHAEVRSAVAYIGYAQEKHALAAKRLVDLPQDHPMVMPVVAESKTLRDLIVATKGEIDALDASLSKVTGMENYPHFEADFKKVQDLGGRYRNWEALVQQPEKYAAVLREDLNVRKEIARIMKVYKPLVEQKTAAGKRITAVHSFFEQKRLEFRGQAVAHRKELPGAIDADIAEAQKMADDAVKNEKPLFFGEHGGIAQRMSWADEKMLMLEAYDAKVAARYAERLKKARADMKTQVKKLSRQIIEANRMPATKYSGKDMAKVVKLAVGALKKQIPGVEVLSTRVVSQAWERDIRWRYSGGEFRRVDGSRLQVQIYVKSDDDLAVCRPVNLYKNHLKGDAITATPFDEVDAELPPHRFYLLKNIQE